MKAKTIFWSVVAMLPMMAYAQTDDDMYFVPKKKSKTENVQRQEQPKSSSATLRSYLGQQADGTEDYHSGALRDVDEYNRRGGTGRSITIVTETDTFQVDESQLTLNEDGQYVLSKGYSGVDEEPAYLDDDYSYTSRLSRFHGFVTPLVTIYDPWYYDPWYYDSWYYRPWRYGYHGWGGYYGWYDPWYYGHYGWGGYYGWHHPHVSYAGGGRNPRGGGRIGGAGYSYRGGGRTTGNMGRSLYGGGRSTFSGGRSIQSNGRSNSYGRGIGTRTTGRGVTSSQGRSTSEGMRSGGINSSSRSTVNGSSRGSSMSGGRSTYNGSGSTYNGGSRSTYSGGSRTGFGSGSRGGGGSFGGGGSRGGGSFGGGSRGGGRR